MIKVKNPLSVICVFLIVSEFSFGQQTTCNVISKYQCNHHESTEKHFNTKESGFESKSITTNYDVRYHRLELSIDPDTSYIKGAITTYFETSGNLSEIEFDLSDSLDVDSIRYHGANITYTKPGDHVLRITLPAPLPPYTLDSLAIYYQGHPYDSGLGSFVKSEHAGAPIIWTLSEPYGARDWWPCKQDLNDKADSIDVIIEVPTGNSVASNGLLSKEVDLGATTLFHWTHRYPIPAYLIAFAVTNYDRSQRYAQLGNGDTLLVQSFLYPEELINWQYADGFTEMDLIFYTQKFGTYPFIKEKYGHAQFGWGGGMEHQTMSFMGSSFPPLIAHEMAHQWFGDKVTCGSWTDIWLNEGFATYATALTEEHYWVNDWLKWKRQTVDLICSDPGGSVFVTDTSSVSRIFDGRLSYRKGAYLLHMLRWKLGDEDFFQAIRNYLNDPDLAYSYARTEDLKQHFEDQSGMDLTEFFEDWFYGEGYPGYQVEAIQKGGLLELKLNQITSHSSVDFFEVPVPITVYGEDSIINLRIDHSFDGQSFTTEIPFLIDSIVIDPNLWLISANNTLKFTRESDIIQVFPNPVSSILTINSSEKVTSIKFFTVDGKFVLEEKLNNLITKIDVSNLSNQVYLLEIQTGANVYKVRVSVNNLIQN